MEVGKEEGGFIDDDDGLCENVEVVADGGRLAETAVRGVFVPDGA